LLFEENGFGNNRACAAGTGEANNSDNQMEKKHSQIAHDASYQDCETSKNAGKIASDDYMKKKGKDVGHAAILSNLKRPAIQHNW